MPEPTLRSMLMRDQIIVAPGVYDCLTARLAEMQGFSALYMTGSGTSFAKHGLADVGLITMTEMVQNAAAIARAVSIPVIADADTGYGNALNVRRTVQEYEAAGVAAIHLEDQTSPKKCGHFDDKALIPTSEMVQKIQSALDARSSVEFLIIARTDAITVNGYSDALARAAAYEKAGADIVFVESPRNLEEVRGIPKKLNVPTLFNMAEGKSPFMTSAELQEFGYRLMIVPSSHRVVIPALMNYFQHLYETGDYGGYRDHILPWDSWRQLVGLEKMRELEERYETP